MIDQNNLETVAVLLGVDKKVLTALYNKLLLLSSHEIAEQKQKSKKVFTVELGYHGTLQISREPDGTHYQFMPSDEFNKIVQETMKTGQSLLITDTEQKVIEKLLDTYKGLF